MNNKQILQKAIKKAIKNGWKVDYKFNGKNVKVKNDSEGLPTFYWIEEDMRQQTRDIIFSHEFAKALWGEEIVDKFGNSLDYFKKIVFANDLEMIKNHQGPFLPAFQYHLQKMVLEKEPLKYLEIYL